MFRFLMRALTGIISFGVNALEYAIEWPFRMVGHMLRPQPDVQALPPDLARIEDHASAEALRATQEIAADVKIRTPAMPSKVAMASAARISAWACQRAAGRHVDAAPAMLPFGYRVWANALSETEIKVIAEAGYKRVFEHIVCVNHIEGLSRATLDPFKRSKPPAQDDGFIPSLVPHSAPAREHVPERGHDVDEQSFRLAR